MEVHISSSFIPQVRIYFNKMVKMLTRFIVVIISLYIHLYTHTHIYIYIYIYIEPLQCTPEINAILYINFISIKKQGHR